MSSEHRCVIVFDIVSADMWFPLESKEDVFMTSRRRCVWTWNTGQVCCENTALLDERDASIRLPRKRERAWLAQTVFTCTQQTRVVQALCTYCPELECEETFPASLFISPHLPSRNVIVVLNFCFVTITDGNWYLVPLRVPTKVTKNHVASQL